MLVVFFQRRANGFLKHHKERQYFKVMNLHGDRKGSDSFGDTLEVVICSVTEMVEFVTDLVVTEQMIVEVETLMVAKGHMLMQITACEVEVVILKILVMMALAQHEMVVVVLRGDYKTGSRR